MSETIRRALANVDDAINAVIDEMTEIDDPVRLQELGERLRELDGLAVFLTDRATRGHPI